MPTEETTIQQPASFKTFTHGGITLHHGDCRDVLREIPDSSIDALVTDPPAAIGVRGAGWDEFGGAAKGTTRGRINRQKVRHTARSRVAFVDFLTEVMEECLRVLKPGGHAVVWGFPRTAHWTACALEDAGFEIRDMCVHLFGGGRPKSLNLKGEYEGMGTGLKPSAEPWWLCRKPFDTETVMANVEKWGTGALNIDACRIHAEDAVGGTYKGRKLVSGGGRAEGNERYVGVLKPGRWPANATHDNSDDVLATFPTDEFGSLGRLFYCPRARCDRGEGNDHNAVKPLDLMQWLCRLVTPASGLILDPFAGSGSTLLAAQREGLRAAGIEREANYVKIALNRLGSAPPSDD